MKPKTYDFGGYATRHDVKCSDGRTIRQVAFKDADGKKVPLVYHHIHDNIENVLGHAILEHRNDGIYAYCSFNNSEKAKLAKEAVEHKDITALSIYANKLKHNSAKDVLYGIIREVSLVLSGANPEAKIDNVAFAHGEGFEESETDVIIHSGEEINFEKESTSDPESIENNLEQEDIEHAEGEIVMDPKEKTVKDVYEALDEEEKAVVEALVGAAVEAALAGELDDELTQSGIGGTMKFNVFDNEGDEDKIKHVDLEVVFNDMKNGSTLQESMLAHGITNIEVLYPEARNATPTPEMISRQSSWVASWMGLTKKIPFSRVKSLWINITEDEARAKGYIKGRQKLEEIIVAGKRKTEPQTVYKLQKLDRDDIIDVTDFDVVSWLQAEMRIMLEEELGRATLIGDGRSDAAEDKINPINIRPVWQDDSLYTTNVIIDMPATATGEDRAKKFIEDQIRARKNYKGSGKPNCYIGTDILTECLLIKDSLGYNVYKSETELATALRVSSIIEVELFDNQTRKDGSDEYQLGAIIVNPADYSIGANKGGELTSFEDFDLNLNKHEYLIETRISGALTKPKSALSFEFKKQ